MKKRDRIRPLDAATEKLEAYLMKNTLAPHEKLPSERDLSLKWKMNRMTLRSAIQRLIAQGKLYSKKGSGTYLAEPKIVRNLQDSRSMTELLNQEGDGPASKVLSFQKLPASPGIARHLGLKTGDMVMELLRVRLVKGQPLMVERTYVSHGSFPDLDRFSFAERSLYEVLKEEYGLAIKGGRETVGMTYAGPLEADQLQVAEDTALFLIDGIAWDDREKPIEFFQSWIRSDHIQLFSILRR